MDNTTFSSIKNHIPTKPKPEQEIGVEVLELENFLHTIVLHNDDVNTFDYVIDSLIEICNHTLEQAQQCTFLVHYKGKCEVKSGDYNDLLPCHQKLLSRGLTSEIV